jgi:hypothetical protein
MTWTDALEIVVARTSHVAFRRACADANPDVAKRDACRSAMIELAIAPSAPPAYPSLARQLTSAASAAGRTIAAVATGRPSTVDDVETRRRLALCHVCPKYVASDDRCAVCGCRAAWKARLANEHCPLPEPLW